MSKGQPVCRLCLQKYPMLPLAAAAVSQRPRRLASTSLPLAFPPQSSSRLPASASLPRFRSRPSRCRTHWPGATCSAGRTGSGKTLAFAIPLVTVLASAGTRSGIGDDSGGWPRSGRHIGALLRSTSALTRDSQPGSRSEIERSMRAPACRWRADSAVPEHRSQSGWSDSTAVPAADRTL